MGTYHSVRNQVQWAGVAPAVDGDQVIEKGGAGDSGTTNIYTVPAGKIFLLFEGFLATRNTGGNGHSFLEVAWNAGGTDYFLSSGQNDHGNNATQHWWPPLEFTAGDVIRVRNNADIYTFAGIQGVVIEAPELI